MINICAATTVQCTVYTPPPLPPLLCDSSHAAQLVRTKYWPLLSSHSKNQKIADGRVKYDRIRGRVGYG